MNYQYFFPVTTKNNVTPTTQKAIKVLEQITPKWEILLIDDGSKDKTPQVAKKLQQQYPKNIKVVTHNPNRGYGAAFKSGIYNSSYKWIAFTDVDGQFDFSEINHFISTQKDTNADLVIGYYKNVRYPNLSLLPQKFGR
jgi:glycosyltransferase involved in cell wall biosynthesis